jgi:hypothetical protein
LISRKGAKAPRFGVLVDRFFLGENLKLCGLAPWRENDPNQEKNVFPQRRKDAKFGVLGKRILG